MALDLNQIVEQVQAMTRHLKLQYEKKAGKLTMALDTMHSELAAYEPLNKKISEAKTTWLVAGLKEKIDISVPVSDCPQDYVVLASDGSHIDVDRHQSTHCFLINVGLVKIRYGQMSDAELTSEPRLYFKEDEVVISSLDRRQVPIEGQILGIKRNNEECRVLVEKAKELDACVPVVAVLDGTLILWALAVQDSHDFVLNELIVNGFLKSVEDIRNLSQNRPVALASYISFPKSTEVVNALRIAICPHEEVNCDFNCSGKNIQADCDRFAGLIDRDIFNILLNVGERSAVFSSRSRVVEKYYNNNSIDFFYIKVGDEIARVEVPRWVADNENLLNLVHSVIFRQCELGFGYPVALMEAHEKAVINGGDRQSFWRLVEQTMNEDAMQLKTSAKQWSKKIRWI